MTACSSIGRRAAALGVALLSCATLAACGGGQRQDASEPNKDFPVQITTATFPGAQKITQHSTMVITVRNTGSEPIPDIAVTVCNVTCDYPAPPGQGTSSSAFASNLSENFLANPSRPVWIVDRPPDPHGCGYSCASGGAGGAATADANTWALGRLRPGASATFVWHVTAVSPGRHVLAWSVGAGLNGKAKAVLAGGGRPQGTFAVDISTKPSQSYVNDAGQIVTTG